MILTVLAVLVIVQFAFAGALKLFSVPMSLEIRDALDVPPGLWRAIGVLEWVGVAGVVIGLGWWKPLGLAACVGFVCLMVGAIMTRLRASRRHERSDTAGLVLDAVAFLLATATGVAFALDL